MSEGEAGSPQSPAKRPIGELRITAGEDAGRMFVLADDTVLGRDEESGVALRDPSGQISRRHARIALVDGSAAIEDLGSTNGTFLNGARIEGLRRLSTGDEIRLGTSVLEFVAAPPSEDTHARPAPDAQQTRARGVEDGQTTRARPVPEPQPPGAGQDLQSTRARPVPEPQPPADGQDLQTTRARPVPQPQPLGAGQDLQSTRARPVPEPPAGRQDPQTTRARPVPEPPDGQDLQATRAQPAQQDPQVTRARPLEPALTRAEASEIELTRAHATPPPELPEREPTYAPSGSEGELRILSGPGAGSTTALVGHSATIGREPECDLQVLDSEVSRRHAKITVRDGEAAIDDLRSSNGTYLNGERILERTRLAPRDRIQIGEATIELTSPVFGAAAERTLPPQVTAVRDIIAEAPKLLRAESGTRKWWTLAAVLITTFMLLLDVTIVAVALPTISRDLHPSFSSLQWIVDGYTLMLTSVLLTAGSMADIFGRKRILSIGLVVFTAASVACAQAPNATFLDLARGVQGVGGATMFACSLALIVQEFPAGERALAFGLYGATNGLSVALGPIIGGLLVQGIGWQAIFYLNVPIAIVAFFMLHRKIVNLPGPPTKIDWPGLVTFSGSLFLIMFATIRGNESGWTSAQTLAFYGAGIVLLVAFVLIERRREFPMFDLGLFRNPTFVGSSVAAITACFAILALIFFLTTWLQSILGYSAVGTGLRMLVFTGCALLASPPAGRMTGTVSPRIVFTVGLALIAGGVFSMTGVSASSSWTAILPGLALAGIGLGLVNPTLASTAVSVVPPWRGGMASGMNSTCRELGTSAGIAVLGTLLQHKIRVVVSDGLRGTHFASLSKSAANAISTGGTPQLIHAAPAAARPHLVAIAHQSYASGLRSIFLVAALMAVAGCLTAVAIVRRKHMVYAAQGGH